MILEENKNYRSVAKRRDTSPRIMPMILGVALLMATLFTAWTPAGLFSGSLSEKMTLVLTSQPEGNPTVNAA